MLLAASLTLGNMFATDSALAKPNNPLKKSDPYEVALAGAKSSYAHAMSRIAP